MKLVFVCPTYGAGESAPIRAERCRRVAIMNAARYGHEWLGDASRDREGWEATRNNTVQEMINDVEGYPDDAAIFWCDADVELPQDAISRLAQYNLDFVTGVYFQRRKPYNPLISTFNGKGFHWIMTWPPDTIMPVDGCGFGCVLTSFRMLRKMEAPWFKFTKYSEDFDFCLKAKEAGFQLYADTGVLCKHMKDAEGAGFEDFKREHPQFYPVMEVSNGTERNGIECERPAGDLAILRG